MKFRYSIIAYIVYSIYCYFSDVNLGLWSLGMLFIAIGWLFINFIELTDEVDKNKFISGL